MIMMIREHSLLRARFPAFLQEPDLFRDIAQLADDFFVPIDKREDGVRNAGVTAKLHHQFLRPA